LFCDANFTVSFLMRNIRTMIDRKSNTQIIYPQLENS